MRRLERQALAVRLQRRFDLGERSAAARRQHELARLVGDDARVAARIEELAARRVAVEVLAAAAAQEERRRLSRRRADALLELGQAQNRGSSGCAVFPPCTRMRPYSAQRASVGTALPGLSRP